MQTLPIDNLLARLIADSHDVVLLWQAGVIVASAAAAWAATRWLQPRLERAELPGTAWREGLRRVGFPLLMLLALLLGREAAKIGLPNLHLLDIAVPLLLALVGVRLVVHALRYILERSESLRVWERTAAWLIWGAFALHVTGLLPRMHAAMEALSFHSGSRRFSLWLLFEASAVIVVAVIVALAVARLVEIRLMRLAQVNLSLRMALSKAIRTVLLTLAVLVALPAVGIDLTVLSVFGGALGVGIGFGLQKVASNYISGFIILLDRSVRIGDRVTVDNKHGEVSQIRTRYTLLRSADGIESIVPNEMLIAQTVVNHSHSRPDMRIALPVRVAYDTDLEHAEGLIVAAAREQAGVVSNEADRAPRVFLKEFADNGVVLELVVWLHDPSPGQDALRSDLNWAIWRRFQAAGIAMPGPQRVSQPGAAAAPAAGNP